MAPHENENIDEVLQNRIVKLMNRNKLSCKELAQILRKKQNKDEKRISESMVKNWRSGRTPIKVNYLQLLCKIFNLKGLENVLKM